MKRFDGFPSRMQFTAVPDMFFSHLLPEITDLAELKTTLMIFYLLYKKRGYPRFTTFNELAVQPGLLKGLEGENKQPEDTLKRALQSAVDRGTILRFPIIGEAGDEDIYYLNAEADRQAMARIANGELSLPGFGKIAPRIEMAEPVKPDVFSLYEENIGMLTPMIAEEIREAQKTYSEIWIRDAIREAANQNKRKWSYISAILESWAAEGRSDGTYRRYNKKADPDKYVKGKYGHMVQR